MSTEAAARVAVVGVNFYDDGPTYWFAPGQAAYAAGDRVLVETAKGKEVGTVRFSQAVSPRTVAEPLKEILRAAERAEIDQLRQWQSREADAFAEARRRVQSRRLPMKLITAKYSYDGERLTFFFAAEGRIDFRDLVKDLATAFGARIELRQVGPRDEAKMINGMGSCGRTLCCGSFLPRPLSPTIKMARNQDLNARNTDKLSGACGRLKCCLSYEDETYQALKKKMPMVGDRFQLADKPVRVIDVQVIKQEVVYVEENSGTDYPKPLRLNVDEFLAKGSRTGRARVSA
jgi:cell fate regulator YaaT (PSP1 superfamily)